MKKMVCLMRKLRNKIYVNFLRYYEALVASSQINFKYILGAMTLKSHYSPLEPCMLAC